MTAFEKEYRRGDNVFTLRSIRVDDAQQVLKTLYACDRETTFLNREPGELSLTVEQERAFLQKIVDDPLQRMLVAQVRGEIVGTCNALIGSLRRQRHSAGFGIALMQKAWGMGIGRTMMEEIIVWLRGEGIQRMHLTVDTKNLRAIALYQRYGFIVEGCIRSDRKLQDGSLRDSYYMALDLTEGT